jgi:probable rRNA maturation factor
MAASSTRTRKRRERLIRIEIANRQRVLAIDRRTLRRAVRAILKDKGVADAEISLAIVDDREMCELHQRYLGEDEPTDVLSFVLERSEGRLEGEVIVSADTARREAARYGNSAAGELLLYAIHGTLHLVGYRDDTRRAKSEMRARERKYLAAIR